MKNYLFASADDFRFILREEAKEKLEKIQEKLKDVNLEGKKKTDLEEEARRLETVINMFDSA